MYNDPNEYLLKVRRIEKGFSERYKNATSHQFFFGHCDLIFGIDEKLTEQKSIS